VSGDDHGAGLDLDAYERSVTAAIERGFDRSAELALVQRVKSAEAEVERLRKELAEADRVHDLVLNVAQRRAADAEAEVERLGSLVTAYAAHMEALTAEVERLEEG
jgi:hypothetical protein